MPGSKSHTIRCVAFAALAGGESEIIAPLNSSDTRAAAESYRQLGAKIQCDENWVVSGTGGALQAPSGEIDVGNSGSTLRFAAGSAALLAEGHALFTGDHQIQSRPIGPLLASLNDLGATCRSIKENNCAPLEIRGQITGGETEIEAVTSQYLTSLLINTPLAANDTRIHVTKLNEQPYAEITLDYLDEFNISYQHSEMKEFIIKGGQRYPAFQKRIPADFSSATFFLCAGAVLDADIVLEGLDFDDTQGDKAVVDILREMGASITVEGRSLHIARRPLKGIDIDMNAIPDALPALAVVGCFAEGTTRLLNVEQARLKETDRIAVMASELTKLGGSVEELPDGLIVHSSNLQPAHVSGHHDHRIVMALSLAAMALEEPMSIDTAEAINVTFPNYVELMRGLGGQLQFA